MALTVTSEHINRAQGATLYKYEELKTTDTDPDQIEMSLDYRFNVSGFMQATGTFGGATVKLQASNDGTVWTDLVDTNQDTPVELTAEGGMSFYTAARYIRPIATGGTSDDIDVTVLVLD